MHSFLTINYPIFILFIINHFVYNSEVLIIIINMNFILREIKNPLLESISIIISQNIKFVYDRPFNYLKYYYLNN